MLSTFADVIIPMVGIGSASYLAKKVWPLVKREILVELVVQSHEEIHAWILRWLQKELKMSRVSKLTAAVQGEKNPLPWERKTNNDNPEIDFLPGDGWHYITYHGNLIYVYYDLGKVVMTGWAQDTPSNVGSLTLWCFGRDSQVLQDLLEDARDLALSRDESSTKIFTCDGWRWRAVVSIQPRPLDTVILDDKIAESVLLDAKEFLGSEKWYRERGVPYRRGYLLYGDPGCGKTSLVKGIAGELGLDICVLSLSGNDMDDRGLKRALHFAPKRTVLLLEDVDAIFVGRQAASAQNQKQKIVTFSGLLNALDGVASQEGRIVFMTTNHLEKLDPALIRPGRCDRKIKFELATSAQARKLFDQFYPNWDDSLSNAFAKEIPNKVLSMAQIQEHLIKCKNQPQLAVDKAQKLITEVNSFSRDMDSDITIKEWLHRLGGEPLAKYSKLFMKEDFRMVEDLKGFTKQQLGQLKDGDDKISAAHQMKIDSLLTGKPHALQEFQFAKQSAVRNEFRKYFLDVECATELEEKLTEAIKDNSITLGQVKSIFQKHVVTTEDSKDENSSPDSDLSVEERASRAVQNVITFLKTSQGEKDPEDIDKDGEVEGEESEEKEKEKEKSDILVSSILEEIDLSQYLQKFEEQDCTTAEYFGQIEENDLKELFDIQIFGHRKKLYKEVLKHKPKEVKKDKKGKDKKKKDKKKEDD